MKKYEFLSDDYLNHDFQKGMKLYRIENNGNAEISEWTILEANKCDDYQWYSIMKMEKSVSSIPHIFLCSLDSDIKTFFIDYESAKKALAFRIIQNHKRYELHHFLNDTEWHNYAKEYIDLFPERCI